MAAIAIRHQRTTAGGRYVATVKGFAGEAELTYSRINPKLVIADHTLTPDLMRGQGVATALVERLVSDARQEGFRIVPRCPFVAEQFDRHPEWSSVRASLAPRAQ